MKKDYLGKRIASILFVVFAFACAGHAQPWDKKVTPNVTAGTQEGEACIAISPIDTNSMVIGFMESSSSALDFKIYTTSDGGSSWTLSNFNSKASIATDFPGGMIAGGGDILLAYDKNGKLYCTWLYAVAKNIITDTLWFVIYWGESTDNGQTFTMQPAPDHIMGKGGMQYLTQTIYNAGEGGVVDREWIACDLSSGSNANNLYCGFLVLSSVTANSGLYVKTKPAGSGTFNPKVNAFTGSAQFSNVMVDHAGTLHYVFGNTATNTVSHCSSSDGGQTMSAVNAVSTGAILFPTTAKYVNSRENAAISFAIDGTNKLHLVWNDYPGSTFPNAYYSSSTDGGVTWSTKLDLNTLFGGGHAYQSVAIARGNKVTIAANVLDNTKKSEYYFITSVDNGQTFGSPVKVSSGITDYATAMNLFMGDYSTGVRTECKVYTAWTDNRASGPKQYVSVFNECAGVGVEEITPVNASYSIKKIYPNPVHGSFSYEVNSNKSDQLKVSLFDLNGKMVMIKIETVSAGLNSFTLDVSSLPSGNYLLSVTNKEEFVTIRGITKQ